MLTLVARISKFFALLIIFKVPTNLLLLFLDLYLAKF